MIPIGLMNEDRPEGFRDIYGGLNNLVKLWRLRRSLPDAQARRLTEYMVEALSESVDPEQWEEALQKACRCVRRSYP